LTSARTVEGEEAEGSPGRFENAKTWDPEKQMSYGSKSHRIADSRFVFSECKYIECNLTKRKQRTEHRLNCVSLTSRVQAYKKKGELMKTT